MARFSGVLSVSVSPPVRFPFWVARELVVAPSWCVCWCWLSCQGFGFTLPPLLRFRSVFVGLVLILAGFSVSGGGLLGRLVFWCLGSVLVLRLGHGGGDEVVLLLWCGMVGSRSTEVWSEVMWFDGVVGGSGLFLWVVSCLLV
ncbi:hypothetical protein P8452_16211 [Trifolium repens]|nr:hypothetical protein P8452_16211 [Trifolium repens]